MFISNHFDTMSNTNTTTLSTTFAFEDADLILRSSFDHEFRVHKSVLSLASSFFREFPYDIDSQREGAETKDGLPVIPMLTKDPETLENLLMMAYPTPSPKSLSFGAAHALLEAGRKYQFSSELLTETLRVSALHENEALLAYLLYSTYGMEDLKRRAAREWCKYTPDFSEKHIGFESEVSPALLQSVSGQELYHLLHYRTLATQAAQGTVSIAIATLRSGSRQEWDEATNCPMCATTMTLQACRNGGLPEDVSMVASQWLQEFIRSTMSAIGECPHVDSIGAPELLGRIMFMAGQCPACRARPSIPGMLGQIVRAIQNWVKTSTMLVCFPSALGYT